jgi:hypothetical protein
MKPRRPRRAERVEGTVEDTSYFAENPKGRYHLGDLDVDERRNFQWILDKQDVAHNMVQYRTFVNTVMNIRVP